MAEDGSGLFRIVFWNVENGALLPEISGKGEPGPFNILCVKQRNPFLGGNLHAPASSSGLK